MLSIIILSSDGYSDCWDPLFASFEKNFPGMDGYQIILSTNTKDYNYPGQNITCLKNGMDTAWSKRLQLSLDQAESDAVLVMVEDFFLLSKMNEDLFLKFLNLVTTRPDVDHIRLVYNGKKVLPIPTDNKYLDRIPGFGKHRFLFLPGLWKKKVLKKYLVDFETPHMAEKMGNYRSWIMKDNFYCVSKEYIEENGRFYDCATSGAIIKGKWGSWLPERMKENGIEIDYSKRGFKTDESQKSAKMNVQINMIKNPVSTLKSLGATLQCFFK